jgi:hypothetical protein
MVTQLPTDFDSAECTLGWHYIQLEGLQIKHTVPLITTSTVIGHAGNYLEMTGIVASNYGQRDLTFSRP